MSLLTKLANLAKTLDEKGLWKEADAIEEITAGLLVEAADVVRRMPGGELIAPKTEPPKEEGSQTLVPLFKVELLSDLKRLLSSDNYHVLHEADDSLIMQKDEGESSASMLELSLSREGDIVDLMLDGEISGKTLSAHFSGPEASVLKKATEFIKTNSGIMFGLGKSMKSGPEMIEPFQRSNMQNHDLLKILLVLKSAVTAGALKRGEKDSAEKLLLKAKLRKLSDDDFTEAYMLSKSESIPPAVHSIANRLYELYLK